MHLICNFIVYAGVVQFLSVNTLVVSYSKKSACVLGSSPIDHFKFERDDFISKMNGMTFVVFLFYFCVVTAALSRGGKILNLYAPEKC